jgi:hypothetical protein
MVRSGNDLRFVLALILATAVGCEPAQPQGPFDAVVTVEGNPDNPFSAVVRASFGVQVELCAEYGVDGAFDLRTPFVTAEPGEEVQRLVLGLLADTGYEIRVVARSGDTEWIGESLSFQTDPLPENWPVCEVTSTEDLDSFDPNEVLCSNSALQDESPMILCVNRRGEPVWSLVHPDGVMLQEFQALPDGSFAGTGHSSSELMFFDQAGAMTERYPPLWFEGKTRFVHTYVNEHEVIALTEGPWAGAVMFMTTTKDVVQGEERLGIGMIAFDPATEVVLWDWLIHGMLGDDAPIDPTLDYDRFGLHKPSGDIYWNHGNAILHGVDDDGGQYVWVSLRAQDWILRVDVETDQVDWRLGYDGDFALVDDLDAAEPVPLEPRLWSFQQHAPEWISRQGSRTRYLVYDNGVRRPDENGEPDSSNQYSRIVEFEIDEESMLATIHFDYGSPDEDDPEHFYNHQLGDADMSPAGDAIHFQKGYTPFMAEITYPEGVERWRYSCPEVPRFYRVDYFPSLYETTWWYDVER